MKELLFSNWTLWRLTRLTLGFTFIIAGIVRYDTVLSLSGGFLVIHAVLNRCAACTTNGCDIKSADSTDTMSTK